VISPAREKLSPESLLYRIEKPVDDSLLHLRHNSPPTAREKSLDPMILEALLMNQMQDARGDSTTPLSPTCCQTSSN
jgi:hypothetical protein